MSYKFSPGQVVLRPVQLISHGKQCRVPQATGVVTSLATGAICAKKTRKLTTGQ